MTNFGWSYPPGCNSTPYDEDDLSFIDDIEKRLKELDEGRNQECWPLHSFGGKDADLDSEGCTGIKEWTEGCTEDTLYLKVGGHKTVCPPYKGESEEIDEDIIDLATEIVCGFGPGEWTGDDWSMSFEDTIKVEVQVDDDGEVDIEATAQAIIKASRQVLEPWEKSMLELDEAIDKLQIV